MWILHFLPDAFILWFCNILLLVGVVLTIAGFFAHRIPLVWQYQLPFKVAGIALLVLGVYFRGGYSVEMQWRERVAEVEARLAQAEKQSQEANVVLEKKGQDRIRVIKEKGLVIKQYIDREITKYDNTCVIPNEVVRAHNAAARNEELK
jgi:signal transduction histidine kinase